MCFIDISNFSCNSFIIGIKVYGKYKCYYDSNS